MLTRSEWQRAKASASSKDWAFSTSKLKMLQHLKNLFLSAKARQRRAFSRKGGLGHQIGLSWDLSLTDVLALLECSLVVHLDKHNPSLISHDWLLALPRQRHMPLQSLPSQFFTRPCWSREKEPHGLASWKILSSVVHRHGHSSFKKKKEWQQSELVVLYFTKVPRFFHHLGVKC